MSPPTCCYVHVKRWYETASDPGPMMFGQPVALMRMFVCQTCGNKRCPAANDCGLTCTHSNEPGQKGSLYE